MNKNFTPSLKLSLLSFCFVVLGFSSSAQTDTIPPVIDLNTDDTLRIQIGSPYKGVNPSATDNQSDPGSILLYQTWGFNGPVNTSVRRTFPETWTAIDSNGNKSEKTRINIVDDYIDPVIQLNTADTIFHKIRTPYISKAPSVTDNYYPAGQVSLIRIFSNVNPSVSGLYREVWEAIDGSGNTTQKIRVVIVGNRSSLSISEVYNSGLVVYPNPAATSFNITVSGHLRIISMDGKTVLDLPAVEAGTSISVSSVSSGVYTLLLNDGEKVFSGKLLVQH